VKGQSEAQQVDADVEPTELSSSSPQRSPASQTPLRQMGLAVTMSVAAARGANSAALVVTSAATIVVIGQPPGEDVRIAFTQAEQSEM
jgi:hypothetical protein